MPVVTDVAVLSTSSVNVSWTTADHGKNTTLSSYLITVNSADSSSWSYHAALYPGNLSSLTHRVTNLPFGPFHQYMVAVKAISGRGEYHSKSSDPFFFRTAEDCKFGLNPCFSVVVASNISCLASAWSSGDTHCQAGWT